MNSLMDLLLNMPSAAQRFQQLAPMLGGGMLSGGLQSERAPTTPDGAGGWEGRAEDLFRSRGYSPEDWDKVQYIIGNESSWNPNAVNPESGAAGIAQNIQGFGPDYSRNDPMEQIRWLYRYLQNHNYEGYGSGIDAAYQHKVDYGWY